MQQPQQNIDTNGVEQSIQLKEDLFVSPPHVTIPQQSQSSLNANKPHINKFISNTAKNTAATQKMFQTKTFSRQLSRLNSIENSSSSQGKDPAGDKNGGQNAMSLKALSKQKNLLQKQQKLMEELINKKKVEGKDQGIKDASGKMISKRGSTVIQGKRGSRVLNANLMAVLRQKIQEEESKQLLTFKYRLRQLADKTKSRDTDFHIAQLVILIIFLIEIILLSFCKKNYFFSFNFWMDLVSTVSLIFDIDFLTQAIFGQPINQDSVSALKASRVSRIASRSTKIVRFIRLLRLSKLQQLYQKAYDALHEQYIPDDESQNQTEHSFAKSNAATSQQNLDLFTERQNQSYGQNHSDFQLRLKSSENRDSYNMYRAPFLKRVNSFEKINNNSQITVIRNFYRRKSLDIKEKTNHRNSGVSYCQSGYSNIYVGNTKKGQKQNGSNQYIDSGNQLVSNLNTQQNQLIINLNSPKKKPVERKSILSHMSHGSNNSHETQNQNFIALMAMKRDSVKQSAFYNSARSANPQQVIPNNKSITFVNPGFDTLKNNPSEILELRHKSKISLNSCSSFGFEDDHSPEVQDPNQKAARQQIKNSDSKIGQRLADITTNRVIIMIFVLVVCIPFFDETNYIQPDYGFDTYLEFLKDEYQSDQIAYNLEKKLVIKFGMEYDASDERYRYPLYSLTLANQKVFPSSDLKINTDYSDLRPEEIMLFDSVSDKQTKFVDFQSEYIIKLDLDLNAYLSIGQTTFIIALLAYSTISFVKDINKLVVSPIERMLENIQLIADNPLNAAKISEEKAMAEQELKKNKIKYQELSQKKNDETYLLESTIMKIGALLAIGFGEAGSKIITKNMQIGGKIDPMIPGKKVMAIFGFCSIKNFADATEILQEKVMIFANEVAELVHVCCDSFHGAVNKNLGDCFLLVWKFTEDEQQLFIDNTDQIKLKNLPLVQNLSDLPVVAFLKAIANARLLSLTPNFIQQHLKPLQKVMPTFKLRLGFGLHVGWGIEGAIGSNFKIDASYLSPNVNMASRLENATKQYGLYFLLSGSLYRLLSPKTQGILRHIDRVTVKGSKQPMDLYTCDVDPYLLRENKFIQKRLQDTKVNKKVLKFISRKRRTDRYKKIIQGQANISQILDTDVDISLMRQNYTDQFKSTYHEALQEYFNGDWQTAKEIFEEAQLILKETLYRAGEDDSFQDGPIQTLTNYMAKFNYIAPPNWFGYRVLMDK